MQSVEMKDIAKAAYLTQLRHGPFTAEELGQRVFGNTVGPASEC